MEQYTADNIYIYHERSQSNTLVLGNHDEAQ